MAEDKTTKLLTTIIEQQGEIFDKMAKMEDKINSILGTPEYVAKAKEIIKLKKYLTKNQLLDEIGLSSKYWKGWRDIKNALDIDKEIDVHLGTGRAETLLVSVNEENTSLARASTFFKEMDKKRDYNMEMIQKRFEVNKEKAKEIFSMLKQIFKGRIKEGAGGIFKKTY